MRILLQPSDMLTKSFGIGTKSKLVKWVTSVKITDAMIVQNYKLVSVHLLH